MIEFLTEEAQDKVAILDELCNYAGVEPGALLAQSPDPYYGATQLRGLLIKALFTNIRKGYEEDDED